MRKSLPYVIALAGIGIAAPALAADPGWYGELRGGATAVEDMHSASPAANMSVDPNTGWTIEGEAGYRFASPFRLGVLAGYQHNNLTGSFQENTIGVCGTGTPCLSGGVRGRVQAPYLFGMGYYDMPLGNRLTLSVGGGLGAERVDMIARTTGTFTSGATVPFTLVDDDDTVFAQRASAQLAYNLSPRTDLTVGYTYTHADTASLHGQGAFAPFTFADSMATHSFTAGMKLHF